METESISSTDTTSVEDSPLGDKYCLKAECGKLLTRRDGETSHNFKRRVHCNSECSKTNPLLHKHLSDAAKHRREEESTRICEICDGEFHRKRTESKKVYSERETCSRRCCDEKRKRKKREELAKITKICENPECKKKFSRHVTEKSIESKEKFDARRTCSNPCGVAVRKTSHKWEKKQSGGGKKPKAAVRKAEPPPPPPTPIGPRVIKIWRPESWGGEYERVV